MSYLELVVEPDERGSITHVILDFDGTISLLREGWQDVMAPVMVEAIAGDTEPTERIRQEVAEYIAESTGLQTIFQMEHLVTMVKRYGLVPADRVLDARGYKAVYNERLMVPVRERIGRIERGEASVTEFVLRGALEFVRALDARGLTLYYASGTDEADVRAEAELLGAAAYARGGIFGALPGEAECSKEKVIRRIQEQHGITGSELLVVGDGPVEIRRAREVGAVALGVASDEVRGHGLNPLKRERLIRAGAHAIVPDFTEWPMILEWLWPSS